MARKKTNKASNVIIPTRFLCHVGGEWKPRNAFSANQLKRLQWHVDNDIPIDPAKTGMTCFEHGTAPKNEIKCSFCGIEKPLDDFSKQSRKTEEPKCKRCVAWIEIQEPGVTPTILPTRNGGLVAEDSIRREFGPQRPLLESHIGKSEPLGAIQTLNLDKKTLDDICQNPFSFSDISSMKSSSVSTIPKRLQMPRKDDTVWSDGLSTTSKSTNTTVTSNSVTSSSLSSSRGMPSRLLSKISQAQHKEALNSVSKESEIASYSTQQGSRPLNAWATSGRQNRRHHMSSVVSSASSSSSSTSQPTFSANRSVDRHIVGNWSHHGIIESNTQSKKRRGGWLKAGEHRLTPQERRDDLDTRSQNAMYIKPEIDRQRLNGGFDD